MKSTYLIGKSLITSLGNIPETVYRAMQAGKSGVIMTSFEESKIPLGVIKNYIPIPGHTRFDSLCSEALRLCLDQVEIDKTKTLLILSTTKGNIELLDTEPLSNKLELSFSSELLRKKFGLKKALVLSNACISGVAAMIVAKRLLDARFYENVIVLGTDVVSRFVTKGFQSVHAMSDALCKPFDKDRNGINLGEAAGAVILSNQRKRSEVDIELAGGCVSNDANHISGPSRTGKELAFAIKSAMLQSSMNEKSIGFISAHGTATIFNDEMEAKAIHHAGLEDIPVHSLKGYFGHTLGAAGVIETIMCMESLRQNRLIPSLGFDSLGVSMPIDVINRAVGYQSSSCIKTASGFGGGNAAIVLRMN